MATVSEGIFCSTAAMRARSAVLIASVSVGSLWLAVRLLWIEGAPDSLLTFAAAMAAPCAAPAGVLAVVRHRYSNASAVIVVAVLIFCLSGTYILHCRYFLNPAPRNPLALIAILASGLAWPCAAAVMLAAVGGWTFTRPSLLRIAAAAAVVASWFVLLLMPLLLLWVRHAAWLAVLVAPAALTAAELVTNSTLIHFMRRHAEPPPSSVVSALRDLERTYRDAAPEFIYVAQPFGPLCEVRRGVAARPTLLVSAAVLEGLGRDEIRGLMAHEWAHLRFSHLRSRLLWDVASSMMLVGVVAGAWPLLPHGASRSDLAGLAILLGTLAAVRHLGLMHVFRRQEAAADRFAAESGPADAVARALRCTIRDTQFMELFAAFLSHDLVSRRVALLERRHHDREG